jgi:type IV secretory pathway VirJ component
MHTVGAAPPGGAALLRTMSPFRVAARFAIVLIATLAVPAAHSEETVSHGRFRDVTLYRPSGTANSFVLFLSGDGGWNQGVVGMAQALAAQGALVAGINVPQLVASLEQDGASCVSPDGDLENLAHFVEGFAKLPTYYAPVLVGYSSGATLAYALLAQAPADTFAAAISLGFCPDLALRKPLCPGEGLRYAARKTGGVDFSPTRALANPWVVLQGELDVVCPASATRQFVAATRNATLVSLPKVGHGYSVAANWQPQLLAAYRSARAQQPRATPASLPGLPLDEVPATGDGDLFCVLLTGDGGWAGLDKQVAAALTARGIPVVALDSLRYFWAARTPDGLAADVDRVLRYYSAHWRKSRAVVIGYSQGADVLPFALNRLPPASRALVARTVMIGPGQRAAFEFHVSNWVFGNAGDRETLPEALRLDGDTTVCLYGRDESDSLCSRLPADRYHVAALPGGHHFNGAYDALASQALAGLVPSSAGAPHS